MNNLFKEFSMEASAAAPTGEVAEEMVAEQEVAAEVATVDGEVKNLEGAIETTEDAIQGLEQIKDFVEAKKEEGGLTEGEAKVVQVATEALLSRFKGNIVIKQPALESFGAAGNRIRSTDHTLEGFSDKIREMWEAVKRWFKKWAEKMGDWFRAHVSVAGRMKKAAAALSEKLATKHGEKQDDSFKMSVSERRFLTATDTDTPVAATLVSSAGTIFANTDKTIKQIKATNETLINAIKALPLEDGKGEGAKNALEEAGKVYNSIAGKVKADDNLLGGMKFTLVTTVAPTSDADADAKTGTGIIMSAYVDFIEKDDMRFEDEKEVKAISKEDTLKALGAVQGICDSIMAMEKGAGQEKSDQKKMEDELNKIVEKLAKKEDAASKQIQRVVRNSGKLLSATTKSRANTVRYFTSVARCWLGYSRRCVNNIVDKKD